MPHLTWDFLNLKPLCNHSFCLDNGQVIPSYVLDFGTLVSSVRNQSSYLSPPPPPMSPKLTKVRSVRNKSSFLPLIHFTEEKGWISVTSVVVCDDYPGYEYILSWLFKFFRLYVKIRVNFYFHLVEVNFSG